MHPKMIPKHEYHIQSHYNSIQKCSFPKLFLLKRNRPKSLLKVGMNQEDVIRITWLKELDFQSRADAKDQYISEWIYEVPVSPKIWTKYCKDFSPVLCHTIGQKSLQFLLHVLGERMTSWIHSEIYWPLVNRHRALHNPSNKPK